MIKFLPAILIVMVLFSCSAPKQALNTPTTATPKGEKHFSATGNEPFWGLTINFDSSMTFKTIDGYELSVPAVPGEKAADANVTRYHSDTDKGSLTVQVFNQPCEDSMSGKINDYRVQVEVKKSGDTVPEVFKGCGNYLGIYQLQNIWVLQSIGATKIDTSTYVQGGPSMEIRLTDNRVTGNAGCNRFSGSMGLEDGKLTFGPLISTKMACENMKLESQLLTAFSGKSLPYRLNEDTLLVGEGSNLMTFKKAVRPTLGVKPH